MEKARWIFLAGGAGGSGVKKGRVCVLPASLFPQGI
jgi:hypothetical protein